MGAFYEKFLGPALFRMDSERAHELGVDSMALLGRFPPLCRLLEKVGRHGFVEPVLDRTSRGYVVVATRDAAADAPPPGA